MACQLLYSGAEISSGIGGLGLLTVSGLPTTQYLVALQFSLAPKCELMNSAARSNATAEFVALCAGCV